MPRRVSFFQETGGGLSIAIVCTVPDASQYEKMYSNTRYAFSRRSISSHSPRFHHDRTRNPFRAWPTPRNDLSLSLPILLSFIFFSSPYPPLLPSFSRCLVIGNVGRARFHPWEIDARVSSCSLQHHLFFFLFSFS